MKRKWTLATVTRAAKPFNTRNEFKKGNPNAYYGACIYGWLEEACAHMVPAPQWHIWTEEMVAKRALDFNSRIEFYRGDMNAYGAAKRLKIMDKVCGHMKTPHGHKTDRYVYVITSKFGLKPNTAVYVGLTFDPKQRKYQHIKNEDSAAYELLNEPGSSLTVMAGPLPAKKAAQEEARLIQLYKSKNMHVLNRNNGGSIGSNTPVWTKKLVMRKALEFSSRTKFSQGCNRAYNLARLGGYLDRACEHMVKAGIQ